jgi:hypothetical protein
MKSNANAKAKMISTRLKQDGVYFIREILGEKLWSKQREIVESVWNNKKTTVKACHGIGKSFTAGKIILAFLFSFKNSIVLSTAPTWRQVEKLIWKEVRAAYAKSRVPLGGELMPKSPELQIIQDQWYAAGISTNDPNRFQGFHEEHILVIADEAAGINEDIFIGMDGLLTSANSRLLLIGNPTSTSGSFYGSFKDPSFNKISISCYETPNFRAFNILPADIANGNWFNKIGNRKMIAPKMITPEWVADKHRKWGVDSPLYQSRVLGQFPTEGDDTLIPLSWVELAMERWEETPEGSVIELGVDVAEFGSDSTCIATRKGRKVLPLEVYAKQSVMETAGKVMAKYFQDNPSAIKIDVIGLGTGVAGRCAEQGAPITRVNVAESPGGGDDQKERFINKRSQLWWALREALDPDAENNPNPLALPKDEELLMDLSSVKYKINSNGKIQVESKDDMKKRIHRSPDRGDAVVLVNAPQSLLEEKEAATPNIR